MVLNQDNLSQKAYLLASTILNITDKESGDALFKYEGVHGKHIVELNIISGTFLLKYILKRGVL